MRNHSRVCFCNHAPPVLLLVGSLRCVRRTQLCPSVSWLMTRGSVFDYHNWVAHELELPSTYVASKLTQAGCEIATKKSKVLSSSVSVGAKLQMRFAGNAGRTEPRNRLYVKKASVHSGAAGALEKSKGRVDQENPWQVVGSAAATATADCASLSVKSKPLRSGGHWAQRKRTCSQSQMASCLAKRMRGKSATMVLILGTRHARAVGRLDAAGHHGKVCQDGGARLLRPSTHVLDDPRA